MPFAAGTVASTVAVCESDVSVQTAGMDGL